MNKFEALRVLGLDSSATKDQIRFAYLKKCKQHHPDTTKSKKRTVDEFNRIVQAYQLLRDEHSLIKRARDSGSNTSATKESFHGSAGVFWSYDVRRKSSYNYCYYTKNKEGRASGSTTEPLSRDKIKSFSSYESMWTRRQWQVNRDLFNLIKSKAEKERAHRKDRVNKVMVLGVVTLIMLVFFL